MHAAFPFPCLNVVPIRTQKYFYMFVNVTKEDDDDRSVVRQRSNGKRACILFIRTAGRRLCV